MNMVQSRRLALVIMSCMALAFSFASGQEPEASLVEAWKGRLLMNGKRPVSVVFKIKRNQVAFTIFTMVYKGKDFPVTEFSLVEDAMSFTWNPGKSETHCLLHKQKDKGYVGDCQTSDSETKIGLMVYPQVPKEITTGSVEESVERSDP